MKYLLLIIIIFSCNYIQAEDFVTSRGLYAKYAKKMKTPYERRIALCIGINKYSSFNTDEKKFSNLNYAINDVNAIGKLFSSFGFDEVIYLKDEQATQSNIINTLLKIKGEINKNDLLVIYYAGHGSEQNADGTYINYIIPYDCPFSQELKKGIAISLLSEIGISMSNNHLLFMLDSCYSGFLSSSRTSLNIPNGMSKEKFLKLFLEKKCVYLLTAGGTAQSVVETRDHGVFTKRVLDFLSDKNKVSVIDDLLPFVKEKVSDDTFGGQKPKGGYLFDGGGDIHIEKLAQVKKSFKTAKLSIEEINSKFDEISKLIENKELLIADKLIAQIYTNYYEYSKRNDAKSYEMIKYLKKLLELSNLRLQANISNSTSGIAAYYAQKIINLNPKDKNDRALAYYMIGKNYYQQGHFEEAKILLRKAFEICDRALNSPIPKHKLLDLLSMISYKQYRFDDAKRFMKRALTEGNITALERAGLYNNLGLIFKDEGQYKKAFDVFSRSKNIYDDEYELNSLGAAEVFNNMALSMVEQRKNLGYKSFDEPIQLIKKALLIVEENDKKLRQKPSLKAVQYRNNLGLVYFEKGDYKKALGFSKEASALGIKRWGEKSPVMAEIYNSLGLINIELEKYSSSKYFLQKALSYRAKTFKDNPITAQSYISLGRLYAKKEMYNKADEMYKKALHIREKCLGNAHLKTVNAGHLLKNAEKNYNNYEQKRKKKDEKDDSWW